MTYEGIGAAPRLYPCPSCGLTDRVSGVPAVYVAGMHHVNVVVPRTDDRMEHTENRLVTTTLAAALAPAPTAPATWTGCLGVPLLVVAIGTFIGGSTNGHWFGRSLAEAHPDYSLLGVISLLAMVVAAILIVSAVLRAIAFRRLMAAGRPAAERLWSRAWYCGRCGKVHFPPRSGDPGGALTFGEFRAVVWAAGGYGHLARPAHQQGRTL
ncbi:hypothetical protein ACFYRC_36965 [Streptomyces sp. NPDC005279]|uniref:hypothetical protein n=1 Tax=Streptomyces sp. NPDC005279 TaxID=3364712 RepID=UPI0036990FB4